MISQRIWLIGGIIVALAIVAVGWLIGVSPQVQAIHDANAQKAAMEEQIQTSQLQLDRLKKDYDNIDQFEAQLRTLQRGLPMTDQLTDFVRQLTATANRTHVSFTSISIDQPQPWATPQGATPPPGVTPENFETMNVSIVATGSYQQLMSFTDQLQSGSGRLFYISSHNLSSAGDGDYTGTLAGTIFVLLTSEATPAPAATP